MGDALSSILKLARTFGCLSLAALWWPATAQELDLQAIEAQIRAGQAEAAYQTLLQYEDRLAGNIRFDYLLGVAAIESGRPDAATFALERVLTVAPTFLGARLDIARAYFELGNLNLAKNEFEALLKQEPPETARLVVERYLAVIDERQKKTHIRYHVELAGGYDTNTNAAVGQTNIFIPALGAAVTIDSSDAATNDAYMSARLGADLTHKFSEQWLFRLGLFGATRDYLSTDGQETTGYGVSSGLDYVQGANKYSFDLQLSHQELDWDPQQTVFGLTATWEHTFDNRTKSSIFGQHSRIRYSQVDNEANDSDLQLLGASLLHALDNAGATLVSASFFAGVDSERNSRIDGGRDLFGVQAGLQRRLTPTLDAFITGGFQWSVYDRQNGLFLVRRTDNQLELGVGTQWRAMPGITVKPTLNFRRNISNVNFSTYKRLEGGIALRWDF